MSVPQHDRWMDLFEEAERDPLPLWTRFGAATLPDTLFPRDYHTNPVLVYFSRRKRWREWLDPWFLALVVYPLLYPVCLLIPSATAAFSGLGLVLLLATVGLPLLGAVHARRFLELRCQHVPFSELVLTRLTPAEIVQALAIPPLADARASVLLGVAAFVVCAGVLAGAVGGPANGLTVLVWSVVIGLVFLLLHARMTLFAGIVAVHVALTGRGWWDTLRRVSSHVAFLVGGLLVVLISSAMCSCVGLVVVILFGILLKEKTNDLAEDLWSRPEEWRVKSEE